MKNNILDRILSALFYCSAGFLGLIYLIFAYLTKRTISDFTLFNIYQSLFISIFMYILSFVYGIFVIINTILHGEAAAVSRIAVFGTAQPV